MNQAHFFAAGRRKTFNALKNLIGFYTAIIFLSAIVSAQTIDTATVRGRVLDPNGAIIVGAKVTIINESTGLQRDTVTNGDGEFTIANLPLTGKYSVTVSAQNFAKAVKENIELRANESALFNFILAVGGIDPVSEIIVTGTTEGIQSDSAELGTRLDLQKIDNTPIIGRKLTNLVNLNSAVRPARGTGDLFLNNYLFVINGSGRRQTTFSLDGSSSNDDWGRQTIFTNLPFSTIQEFTVITNPISAEFGRTAGNVVNIVTKSGTNAFHADGLFMVRPSGLQAKQPLANRRTRDQLYQFSGVVSGAVVKDKTHFLIGAESNRQERSTVISSTLAPGIFDGKYKQGLFFARLDHQINENNTLTGRFNLERFTDTNPSDAVGGLNLASAARTFERDTYAAQLSENAVLSSKIVNEARFQFQLGSPITKFTPQTLGTQFIRPISTEGESRSAFLQNHQYQFADTLSVALGKQSIKFGGDVEYSSSGGIGQEFGTGFFLGQFRFTNPRSSNALIPTSALTIADAASFTQSFGNANYRVGQYLWSLFAQDDFRVRRDLTLNLGLRYDRQTFTDDKNNLAPRLGFAYNFLGDNKTVVRGSYGVYYSQLRANLGAQFALGGPTGIFTYTATQTPGMPPPLGFPTSLTALPVFPAGAPLPARDIVIRPGKAAYYNQFFDVSKLRFYPDKLLNPTTQQGTIGVERDLSNNFFLKIDYVRAHTNKIDRLLDANAPSTFIPSGTTTATLIRTVAAANLTRPIVPVNNGFRRIQIVANEGVSDYNGLQINLEKRFSSKFSFLASYTLSKTTNTVEPDAGNGEPQDINRLGEFERGLSLLDQRHRFVFSGYYQLPYGFTIGGVQSAASGRPYAITAGVDVNGDASTADRLFDTASGTFLRRNTGKGSATYSTDFYAQKSFTFKEKTSLEFRVELFNAFNNRNIYGRNGAYGNNGVLGTPTIGIFGTAIGGIASVDPSREIQFQARFRY